MDALGLLMLAVGLCAALVLSAPGTEPPQPPPRGDQLTISAAERVILGWPVPADCPDPEAWEALPGIGPALGGRLAEAAASGLLTSPEDLLQVHGIGTKMAAALARRVDFGLASEREVE
jgi:hypothetical protein